MIINVYTIQDQGTIHYNTIIGNPHENIHALENVIVN